MIRDWHAISLVRRGHIVHMFTDPACRFHHAPRPGSRLDQYSRGISCPACIRISPYTAAELADMSDD